MNHLLDNPIWNALNSGNKHLALGIDQVKYFVREVALFAGMADYSESNFSYLREQSIAGDIYILFTPGKITVPKLWEITVEKPIIQMVYPENISLPVPGNIPVVLTEKDIPAMLDLTARTNPGPFLNRTIDFGNYIGFFEKEKLISMAGQRLQPDIYTEISAVCTEPEYSGQGLARQLILNQVNSISSQNRIPFLHLMKENTVAFNLYKKLGFRFRREMMVYVIKAN